MDRLSLPIRKSQKMLCLQPQFPKSIPCSSTGPPQKSEHLADMDSQPRAQRGDSTALSVSDRTRCLRKPLPIWIGPGKVGLRPLTRRPLQARIPSNPTDRKPAFQEQASIRAAKTNTSKPCRRARPRRQIRLKLLPRQSPETHFAENIAAKSRVASDWCAGRPMAVRAPLKNLVYPTTPPLPPFCSSPMKTIGLHRKDSISHIETKGLNLLKSTRSPKQRSYAPELDTETQNLNAGQESRMQVRHSCNFFLSQGWETTDLVRPDRRVPHSLP